MQNNVNTAYAAGDPSVRRRRKIVMSSRDPLAEYRALAKSYSAEAKRLEEHRSRLYREMRETRDTSLLPVYERRLRVLSEEKFELLRDMRDILKYIEEREK